MAAIRSHERFTVGGMHFPPGDLLKLAEEVLPGAFGGQAADYQLVEEAGEGTGRVSVVVSPRPLPEGRVIETVLGFLGSRSRGDRMMAEQWAASGTLRVVRREPEVGAAGKVRAVVGSSGVEE